MAEVTRIDEMELTGEPALDFVNSGSRLLERYPDPAVAEASGWGPFADRLLGWSDLLTLWSRTGTVGEDEAAALERSAGADPARAAAVFDRALRLREALYRLLMSGLGGPPPRSADLERVRTEAAEAAGHRRIAQRNGGFELEWEGTADPARVLWPAAVAGLDLLLSADRDRVKRCAGEDCNWLFYDGSRNRSRRWCEMSSCGNRAKARRFQQRHG